MAVTLVANPLHEGWSLTHLGGDAPQEVAGATVPAEVPGSTHVDLLRAGLIPDPYLDRNEKALEWMWTCSWRYATEFAATPATDGERVDLVFDGLDTVATVRLNGTEVARTKNMHRSYRFDVRELIRGGANALEVDFASALEYANGVQDEVGFRPSPYPHPYHAIRKMACSFGWDWGPDLQTAGIWKGVRIERWRTARLDAVRPLVTVDGTQGTVQIHVDVERASSEPLTVHASAAGIEASVAIPAGETAGVVTLEIPDVERWWPHGYGEARLYDLTVDLHSSDELLDSYARRIGFRSVEVVVENEGDGAGFTYVVNGQAVFVKGANWIPDDHLMTRITKERLARRIGQAVDANMNLIRIWGGGIYETEDFYDLCDERGVMVWQDFPFACAAYAEGSPIVEEVRAEARENVARLTPHASLVMYNGSNENIWGWCDWGWPEKVGGDGTWGLKYYEEILPEIVAELDPTRFYTPSSPYSPFHTHEEVHPNDKAWGTSHEWEVWNRLDYTHYRSYVPRFMSEFGFQGPATWATVTRSLPEDQRRQDSEGWLLHQKADHGNDKLNGGLAAHLPAGRDFEEWHWATSLNQARAIEFGIAHYRSWWPQTAGAIVWQLNDCWPVTSWAAVDGDERPKPLWYALKHVFAPRLLTFQPRGADGGLDPEGATHLVAVNDTDQAWSETLTFTRMSLDGTELAVATAHLAVEPRSTATLAVPGHVLETADASAEVLVADAGYPGDDDHVRGLHVFAEDKDVAYERAPYRASAVRAPGGYEVTVAAHGLVRDLTVLADKVHPDAQADDALVTLVAEQSHVFRISCEAEVDPEAFLADRVLVSVNSLVG
ncbi:glycoside hydrolase family 2 protein [Demequina activiva]|uniref:beta-mannosidase n=1 Tax=Demequina activiva TaxID=1582364 RepID=A0A919UKA5_9MICO|nr:glycoside hydrolase family 2 protein [Demequina activiva]GIG53503.1 beta-mannosidase [Demequina activiva]